MAGIIQSPGFSGGRQGVMKEKVVSTHIAEEATSGLLEEAVNHMIEEGYQPIPQTYSVAKNDKFPEGISYSMVLLKTEMKVEMI